MVKTLCELILQLFKALILILLLLIVYLALQKTE